MKPSLVLTDAIDTTFRRPKAAAPRRDLVNKWTIVPWKDWPRHWKSKVLDELVKAKVVVRDKNLRHLSVELVSTCQSNGPISQLIAFTLARKL